jgi:AcrR family transcriptional regulator
VAIFEPGPPDLSRRERKKAALRRRILDCSLALFDHQGFAATRVADICERADVAQKTFFNHFESKGHLLREIASEALDRLLADLEAARKGAATTEARLHRFFEQVVASAEQAGPMHRELLTEMIHVAHEAGTGTEQARRLHDAFGALIREGRAAGEVTPDHDDEVLTEMVMGAFYALMFNWANLEGYPLRERATAASRFLAQAITISTRPGRERP